MCRFMEEFTTNGLKIMDFNDHVQAGSILAHHIFIMLNLPVEKACFNQLNLSFQMSFPIKNIPSFFQPEENSITTTAAL